MSNKTRSKAKPKLTKKEQEVRDKSKKQIVAIVMFFTGLFLLFVTIIPGESAWQVMRDVLFGLFGYCAFLWPLLLLYVAVLCAADSLDKKGFVQQKLSYQIIEISLLIIFIGGMIHVLSPIFMNGSIIDDIKLAYSTGLSAANGGVFGAALGGVLEKIFGRVPAIITLAILIVVLLMLFTGTTLMKLFRGATMPVRKIQEYAETQEFADERSVGSTEKGSKPTSNKKAGLRLFSRQSKVVTNQMDERDHLQIDIPFGKDAKATKKRRSTRQSRMHSENQVLLDALGGEDNVTPRLVLSADSVRDKNLDTLYNPSSVDGANAGKARQLSGLENDAFAQAARGERNPFDDKDDTVGADLADKVQEAKKEIKTSPIARKDDYIFPPISALQPANSSHNTDNKAMLQRTAQTLVDALESFNVSTQVINISQGPSVTRYELQPAAGVKISRITNLADDIALNLAAPSVRIEAPIPGKAAVGIEIPNHARDMVTLREIIETETFQKLGEKSKVNVALGRDIAGDAVCADLFKMPHLLIAGTTGSGKSVCVNAMVMSILYNATPDEVRLLMIDPKQVEFTVYDRIPHLLVPVVTDPRKAAGALAWAVEEMLRRYNMFSQTNVRDISGYNKFVKKQKSDAEEQREALPQIVIFIDELSDLMMAAPKDVEASICRLAQMARAAGMHLVIATQRPSVDVITGLIKANIPSRIALTVSSATDSRTILDSGGAEKLLGNGDMLFAPIGSNQPTRIQGCFVSEREIERVVSFIKKQTSGARYDENISEEIEKRAVADPNAPEMDQAEQAMIEDDRMDEAIEIVVETGRASTSYLQNRMRVGYSRASRIIDDMEKRGIVGPYEGGTRDVYMTKVEWMEMRSRQGS